MVCTCHIRTRDSFRKISKGGKTTSEDILGGARIQWAVFNLKRSRGGRAGGRGAKAPPMSMLGGGGPCPQMNICQIINGGGGNMCVCKTRPAG